MLKRKKLLPTESRPRNRIAAREVFPVSGTVHLERSFAPHPYIDDSRLYHTVTQSDKGKWTDLPALEFVSTTGLLDSPFNSIVASQ